MNSMAVLLHKSAQGYPLKKGRYDLMAQTDEIFDPTASVAKMQRRMTQEITTGMSTCCTYDEMCQMWEKLPGPLQNRTPKLIYRASEDGFNLSVSYLDKIKPFESENRSCILLVQTEDQETYGLFLDDLVRIKVKDYAGQFENFLFSSIRSTFHVYKPTSINPKDFKKEDKNFEVGPAPNTRPNIKDLAPALPMCPKIFLERKKPGSGGTSSSDDHIKRSA